MCEYFNNIDSICLNFKKNFFKNFYGNLCMGGGKITDRKWRQVSIILYYIIIVTINDISYLTINCSSKKLIIIM